MKTVTVQGEWMQAQPTRMQDQKKENRYTSSLLECRTGGMDTRAACINIGQGQWMQAEPTRIQDRENGYTISQFRTGRNDTRAVFRKGKG
jgi:hypothetical protein